MPEEDGCSLMRRIRARERITGGRLKAVALTAFADKEHESEALNAGFDAFIGKPLRPQMFAQTISDLVRYSNP
jgi:CheY-like chemotaxis protein